MLSTRPLRLALAAGIALSLLAGAVQAAPGVGYDPQALQLRTSYYWVQDPVSGRLSQRTYTIDWSATNPFGSTSEFERRWGPGSLHRKKWVGPDNELEGTVKAALEWAFLAEPSLLGGSGTGRDGRATAIEITDACATGHGTAIVVAHAKAEWPGTSPDRRIDVRDPSKPPGDFSEPNPYWPVTMYYYNTFRGILPVSPQVELPPD
jgi:hypothetical protein